MTPFLEEGSRGRFTSPPPERGARRGPALLFVLLAIVAVAGAGYIYWTHQHPAERAALAVHVVAPQPAAVYRWFSTAGTVIDLEARPLSFEAAGHVAEIQPKGTAFAAGDILGKLQGAAALEIELGHHRSRLAAAEQVRDSLKAAGRRPELHQAELRLADKQKLVDDTQASLNKLLLRSTEPGQILETMVKAGAQVAARAPVIKWKGPLLHGDFTLDEEDFATAGKLDFCRVEVSAAAAVADAAPAAAKDGARFVDCKLPPPPPVVANGRGGSPLHKLVVALPPEAGLATGQILRLARRRYDAVFPLPPAAVVHTEAGDRVWVATQAGTAELRPVTVAELRDEALISQGLNVGDQVIIDAPADLQNGARIVLEK